MDVPLHPVIVAQAGCGGALPSAERAVGFVDSSRLCAGAEKLAHLLHPRLGVAADFGIVIKNALNQHALATGIA